MRSTGQEKAKRRVGLSGLSGSCMLYRLWGCWAGLLPHHMKSFSSVWLWPSRAPVCWLLLFVFVSLFDIIFAASIKFKKAIDKIKEKTCLSLELPIHLNSYKRWWRKIKRKKQQTLRAHFFSFKNSPLLCWLKSTDGTWLGVLLSYTPLELGASNQSASSSSSRKKCVWPQSTVLPCLLCGGGVRAASALRFYSFDKNLRLLLLARLRSWSPPKTLRATKWNCRLIRQSLNRLVISSHSRFFFTNEREKRKREKRGNKDDDELLNY